MASCVTPAVVEALKPLLQFIYKGEGGYDSYNRGVAGDSPGSYPGGLQRLTVAQVQGLQAKGKCFAVGAAQFIPETLKMAVSCAGVNVTDLFCAEVQDRLTVGLLVGGKRPALAAYLMGESEDLDAAQLDAAKEWASIPTPEGYGYYDGDKGGNKATASVKAVRGALQAGRAALLGNQDKVGNTQNQQVVLFDITAIQDTYLKKKALPASELDSKSKKLVKAGVLYRVVQADEIVRDAHQQVVLSDNAGTWYIYQPHWKTEKRVKVSNSIDWSDFDCRVTAYLTVGEILQWDKRRIPAPNSADIARILRTAAEHTKVREAWGGSLGITSFYRPEPINTEVGGVRNSRHITGIAMDVYPTDRSLESFYQWIRLRWLGGLGDGRNKGFIHLDLDGGGFVPGAGARPSREWLY